MQFLTTQFLHCNENEIFVNFTYGWVDGRVGRAIVNSTVLVLVSHVKWYNIRPWVEQEAQGRGLGIDPRCEVLGPFMEAFEK